MYGVLGKLQTCDNREKEYECIMYPLKHHTYNRICVFPDKSKGYPFNNIYRKTLEDNKELIKCIDDNAFVYMFNTEKTDAILPCEVIKAFTPLGSQDFGEL